jgi:hypothetical protein
VTFKVPMQQLAFVGTDNQKHLEEGDFKIQVADQTTNFTLTQTKAF